MKKRLVMLWILLLVLPGCGGKTAFVEETPPAETETEELQEDNALPGSWTVPEGWVKAERYSTEDKIFYVEEGHEEDERPDNISVEVGTNRYGAEEHEQFREAVVRQLAAQAAAEYQRLKREYHPLVPEDLVLTTRELERICADVQFATTENPTKEDIRQRLRYYRTLDIADEPCT